MAKATTKAPKKAKIEPVAVSASTEPDTEADKPKKRTPRKDD